MSQEDVYSVWNLLLRKHIFEKESDAIIEKITQDIEEIALSSHYTDKLEVKKALADIIADKLQKVYFRVL